jgi:hypothetical protein
MTPVQCVLGFFPGGKRPGREVNPTPPYSAGTRALMTLTGATVAVTFPFPSLLAIQGYRWLQSLLHMEIAL